MLLSLLNEQTPTIQGNKIIVQTRNNTEAMTLKTKYNAIIQQIYDSFGFPSLTLDAEVSDDSDSQHDYEQFIAAKQKEDEERARQALVEMQQQESARKVMVMLIQVPSQLESLLKMTKILNGWKKSMMKNAESRLKDIFSMQKLEN
ncbi:hypothetical protein ACI2OX_12890 [Bacillus sp. N9]